MIYAIVCQKIFIEGVFAYLYILLPRVREILTKKFGFLAKNIILYNKTPPPRSPARAGTVPPSMVSVLILYNIKKFRKKTKKSAHFCTDFFNYFWTATRPRGRQRFRPLSATALHRPPAQRFLQGFQGYTQPRLCQNLPMSFRPNSCRSWCT